MKPQAIVFDAYGTLFDVHSVLPAEFQALSQLWRNKQIEYTWRRALMRQYRDFRHVTEEALRSAAKQLSVDLTEPQIDRALQAYLSPAAFPEVKTALEALKDSRLAILSNGSPAMLQAAVHANDLESYFCAVMSVDALRTYKPDPAVYSLASETLMLSPGEMLFVSANAWDAAGAKASGFRVCLCNRTWNRSGAEADCLGFSPDFVVEGLDQILTTSI